MVLTKVSGDLISIISETGATSNLAATLGSKFCRQNGELVEKYGYIIFMHLKHQGEKML